MELVIRVSVIPMSPLVLSSAKLENKNFVDNKFQVT